MLARNNKLSRSPQGPWWVVVTNIIRGSGIMSPMATKFDMIGPFCISGINLGIYLKYNIRYESISPTHRQIMGVIQNTHVAKEGFL